MTTKTKSVPARGQSDVKEQMERMAALNGATMGIFAEACQAYMQGVAAFNREVAGFVNQRLRHDAELGQSLVRCDDWSKAIELQQHWAREATEEYLNEAGKLMELGVRVTSESWTPVYERASKAFGDLRKATS